MDIDRIYDFNGYWLEDVKVDLFKKELSIYAWDVNKIREGEFKRNSILTFKNVTHFEFNDPFGGAAERQELSEFFPEELNDGTCRLEIMLWTDDYNIIVDFEDFNIIVDSEEPYRENLLTIQAGESARCHRHIFFANSANYTAKRLRRNKEQLVKIQSYIETLLIKDSALENTDFFSIWFQYIYGEENKIPYHYSSTIDDNSTVLRMSLNIEHLVWCEKNDPDLMFEILMIGALDSIFYANENSNFNIKTNLLEKEREHYRNLPKDLDELKEMSTTMPKSLREYINSIPPVTINVESAS